MSKILVVDDDFYQRDLYQQVFIDAGFTVIIADDGQDAWEKLQEQPVDLVFTGIDMPRMDGFELTEKIRDKTETMAIPVIIFSHLGREEDREKAKKLYNAHFMIKGYDNPLKILKQVQELLGDNPVLGTHRSDVPHNAPHPKPPPNGIEDDRPGNTNI
ncbi:MAG: response regulator [Candidatus Doudnabacteria bacterium]|nr:response regulator [Candidatus Doudnabacteria bacterium]